MGWTSWCIQTLMIKTKHREWAVQWDGELVRDHFPEQFTVHVIDAKVWIMYDNKLVCSDTKSSHNFLLCFDMIMTVASWILIKKLREMLVIKCYHKNQDEFIPFRNIGIVRLLLCLVLKYELETAEITLWYKINSINCTQIPLRNCLTLYSVVRFTFVHCLVHHFFANWHYSVMLHVEFFQVFVRCSKLSYFIFTCAVYILSFFRPSFLCILTSSSMSQFCTLLI